MDLKQDLNPDPADRKPKHSLLCHATPLFVTLKLQNDKILKFSTEKKYLVD